MKPLLLGLLTVVLTLNATVARAADSSVPATKADAIKVSEGVLTIPTYQSPGRDMNPPLFSNSNLIGLYPFTTYRMPYKAGGPVPEKYPAVFVENEYLKLTYIPELGGRFFRLYDKLHHKDVFYHNDAIKPADYTKRYDFPLTGIELTGPYDDHSRTLHGEPYWSHTIIRHKDGSVSVLLAQTDPIYHMDITFTATLYPGVAAMETSVFCYNPNDGQKPQMFWTSASMHSTPKTRFLYPMTRTVGHTTGEVASWPEYNGIDYSWDRNNHNMLGVFGMVLPVDLPAASRPAAAGRDESLSHLARQFLLWPPRISTGKNCISAPRQHSRGAASARRDQFQWNRPEGSLAIGSSLSR
jgi:hypothetical protein